MARFATGKYAKAICDRCGFKYRYLDLRTEDYTKLRVCVDCLDSKALERYRERPLVADAQRLRHPRPDRDED